MKYKTNSFFSALAAVILMTSPIACSQSGVSEATPKSAIDSTVGAGIIKVTILGSGTPVPSRTQVGTSVLVEAGDALLLFDCGRACSSRLAEYKPELVPQLDKLFLTHLHSDHVVGIPDLWLNGWTQGRPTPLEVWGPDGVTELMEGLEAAFAADLGYRDAGPGQPVPEALKRKVNILEDDGSIIYNQNGVTVTAFPVDHAHILAYGFRVDYQDGSVLISGDTTATPNLAKYGEGADLVLLEVLSPGMVSYLENTFPPARVQAILSLHMTASQASAVFAAIDPRLGVYYHTVASCQTDAELLEQTAEIFSGDVKVARDLMQITLNSNGAVSTQFLSSSIEDCL